MVMVLEYTLSDSGISVAPVPGFKGRQVRIVYLPG